MVPIIVCKNKMYEINLIFYHILIEHPIYCFYLSLKHIPYLLVNTYLFLSLIRFKLINYN